MRGTFKKYFQSVTLEFFHSRGYKIQNTSKTTYKVKI